MPDSNWWESLLSSYVLPDHRDEARYDSKPDQTKPVAVRCCACWKVIDSLETHVLKTLYFGWHINVECLKNMEDWIIGEYQRRKSTTWNGIK